MSFAQPLFLIGTLAALIPLLVHLFDRRRPREVPFAALDFVLRSQKRTASRLRLKRLLLYILRTLILLAVPLALARPSFGSGDTVDTRRGLAATTVVLDTSLALRWSDGTRLFDLAKDEAKSALRDLSPEEPATVLVCTRAAQIAAPLGFERTRLIAAIDDAQPGFGSVDLNQCLEQATRALDDSPLPNRRIVLVSALTQSALRLEAPPPVGTTAKGEKLKPEFVVRDVAKGKTLGNRALIDVHAEAAPQLGPRAWQFTFTVRNFAAEAVRDVELRLEVNGDVVQKGFVDVAADGTAQKTLAWRFDAKPLGATRQGGETGGAATVTGRLEADALADDDARSVVLSVPRALTALVVNGAPSSQKYRDEAFFTDAALSATGSPVRAVVRDADAAWREKLADYDVVVLLNVEAPPAEAARGLREFVEAGGGLFISVGDRVDPDAWNLAMADVLPRKLRVVKTAVEPNAPDAATRAARLTQVSLNHPVLAPFTGRAREGLLSTRFFRYALFEGDGTANAAQTEVLGTMDDGAPVFLASRRGKGRVFVFASTVDRDWCDLAIRTSFLPLMQRIAAWLTGTLDEREEVKAEVGGQVLLTPEPGQSPAWARAPSGAEVALTALPDQQPRQLGGQTQQFGGGPLPEPGAYVVVDAQGTVLPKLGFAAAIDPGASNLSRHSLDALTDWAGEDSVRVAGGGGPQSQTPMWTWLLTIAVLAFFFEGVLLRR
ncbi:MAG: BatA domain-containing protein [Archangium sp.]|nr:BatA domain-containing protein [Archangium sp.]